MANTAEARLEALKENRQKHNELKKVKISEGMNYEKLSQQKQKELDQPVLDYFNRFWFLSPSENSSNTTSSSDKLFHDNKYDIKENFRLAQKAANATSSRNNTQNLTIDSMKLGINPGLSNALKVGQTIYDIATTKPSPSQYVVDNVTYKTQYNPELKQLEIQRNSSIATPKREFSQTDIEFAETLMKNAQDIKNDQKNIKYEDSTKLKAQLDKENAILANQIIPNQSNIVDTTFITNITNLWNTSKNPVSKTIVPK